MNLTPGQRVIVTRSFDPEHPAPATVRALPDALSPDVVGVQYDGQAVGYVMRPVADVKPETGYPAGCAAVVAGALVTLAPIDPQAVRDACHLIDLDAPFDQAPDVAVDLALVDRVTAWLPHWERAGVPILERNLAALDSAEDRLGLAYGYPVATDAERFAARCARADAEKAVNAMAEALHPELDCPRCHSWLDCSDADKANRDAAHTDWVNRWGTTS